MIVGVSKSFVAAVCAGTVSAVFWGCSLLPRPNEDMQEAQGRPTSIARKVVQLGFGQDAVFAACIEPACPITTRKTLAGTQIGAPSAAAAVESFGDKTTAAHVADDTSMHTPAPGRLSLSRSGTHDPALVLYFPFGGASLTSADKAALDELVPLASNSNRITIAGRTDNSGSDSANYSIALARANAVRDYLRAKLSVPDEALMIDVQGSCCYVAPNDTAEGRKQNRRVEIVLSVPEQVAR